MADGDHAGRDGGTIIILVLLFWIINLLGGC